MLCVRVVGHDISGPKHDVPRHTIHPALGLGVRGTALPHEEISADLPLEVSLDDDVAGTHVTGDRGSRWTMMESNAKRAVA